MAIQPIGGLRPVVTVTSVGPTSSAPASAQPAPSFEKMVKDAVSDVNHLQSQADDAAVRLATGDTEDVHRAMTAMQKAKLALDLTIQVRNKVIEAYQEVMRMQV